MSITYSFIVATRVGEGEAQLTDEQFRIDSTSLRELISIYHGAVGEETPYIGWMEDAISLGDVDGTVDADDCTDPDACLETIAALRAGIATHAAALPPFTWITPRYADGRRGHTAGSARVQFEGEPWDVPGEFEPTVARQVIDREFNKKKGRTVDLRSADTWACQEPAGQPLVLEFDRRPFHVFVERTLTGITNICEAARKQGGLVAIGNVL